MSAWLREAGRRRLDDASGRITTVEELRTFFANCPEEGDGPEPDWEGHLATMDRSRRSGLPEP